MTAQQKADKIFEATDCRVEDVFKSKIIALAIIDEVKKHLIETEVCFINSIEPANNYKYWNDVEYFIKLKR